MAQPTTIFAVNTTITDSIWSTAPSEDLPTWVLIDKVNDAIGFLDSQQTDGDATTDPKYPVIIPSAGSLEAPKTFLIDDSGLDLKQINLAGTTDGDQAGGDNRYVFAVYFSGATASIPYLEAWHEVAGVKDTDGDFIGDGTGGNSTLSAIATTNALPGSAIWAGTKLMGETNRISLDTGALTTAKTLYWNMKQDIPSTFTPETAEDFVVSVRYTYT